MVPLSVGPNLSEEGLPTDLFKGDSASSVTSCRTKLTTEKVARSYGSNAHTNRLRFLAVHQKLKMLAGCILCLDNMSERNSESPLGVYNFR